MFETDCVYDDVDAGCDTDSSRRAWSVSISPRIGACVEGMGIRGTDAGVDFRGGLGLGGTYGIGENIVRDAGVNPRIVGEVDDFNIFTGIALRF